MVLMVKFDAMCKVFDGFLDHCTCFINVCFLPNSGVPLTLMILLIQGKMKISLTPSNNILISRNIHCLYFMIVL